MSVLVVGISHRTAPIRVLEQVCIPPDQVPKLLDALRHAEHVAEALVVTTCNRIEIYADVTRFHAGVEDVSALLSEITGSSVDELAPYLYVHYEDQAVEHLFSVACGLDSMVVGESQILGQLRAAHRTAKDEDAVGRVLDGLVQQALRVGKRAHSETGIDRVGASMVSVGLDHAAIALGDLAAARVLVIGAGSMSALAAATLQRRGCTAITVANRTVENATRLAGDVGGLATGLADLSQAVADADLVISATGATGIVVPADVIEAAMAGRERPLVLLDLALPRDIDPSVVSQPGVTLIDLATLQDELRGGETAAEVEAVRRVLAEEVAGHLAWQRSNRVAPTVVALRAKAAGVVDVELTRLLGRLPDLDGREREEISHALNRVVDKLLHGPTVRVKELAQDGQGDSYAEALRELFELGALPSEAVSRAAMTVETDPAEGDVR
ncbi:MAG: glutamyl-tRNA reductase [Frankiaceae bacterium]|jgi:glutamyl-tRNA reductase|nr:glutamyl-tRNA reductase [Frankiaceae bacterium]